ncbi:MAG: hypothetical protein WCA11_12710 [Terracidiphilus sp.]
MIETVEIGVQPELKEIIAEASRALAHLDAGRLEELASSCEALNREMNAAGAAGHRALAKGASEAVKEMAVFSRVLTATRANVEVMNFLQELRAARLEYSPQTGRQWMPAKASHGDD